MGAEIFVPVGETMSDGCCWKCSSDVCVCVCVCVCACVRACVCVCVNGVWGVCL